MTQEQLDLILCERFPRLCEYTSSACAAVILDGLTAYAAEKQHGCKRGTVSRYVNKIYAELAFCEAVVANGPK